MKAIVEVIAQSDTIRRKRWFSLPRFLGEGRTLAEDYVCYPLQLPAVEKHHYRRALREAEAVDPVYWATGVDVPSLPVRRDLCSGKDLLYALALCEFRATEYWRDKKVLLVAVPPAMVFESATILLEKGVEVLLYQEETHYSENIAHKLYHDTGLAVQAVFRPAKVDADVAVVFDPAFSVPLRCPVWKLLEQPARLQLADGAVSAGVAEAMLRAEGFDFAASHGLNLETQQKLVEKLKSWNVQVLPASNSQTVLDFLQ